MQYLENMKKKTIYIPFNENKTVQRDFNSCSYYTNKIMSLMFLVN